MQNTASEKEDRVTPNIYIYQYKEEMEEHKVNYFQGLVQGQGFKTCAHS